MPRAEASTVDIGQMSAWIGEPIRATRSLIRRDPSFPDAVGRDVWQRQKVFEWAAAKNDVRLRRIAPPKYQESTGEPAPYLGASAVDDPSGGRSVVLTWGTSLGAFHLIYPSRQARHTGPERAATWLRRDSYAVSVVWTDWGWGGPALESALFVDPAQRVRVTWSDIHHLLGAKAPFWPPDVRDDERILEWTPSTPAITVPATTSVDVKPWLLMAALHEDDSPIRRTLTSLAREAQWQATEAAAFQMELLDQSRDKDSIALAAHYLPTPEADPDDIPEDVRRGAWLEILDRRDELAIECVRLEGLYTAGRDLPYPQTARMSVQDAATVAEWANTLVPTDRSAGHASLSYMEEQRLEYFEDPVSGAPVVRTEQKEYIAAVPFRLPTTSPLAEVVLDGQVWIRTEDHNLYLAPLGDYGGVSWGYSGSGPSTLAMLIDRLLDDITARGDFGLNGPLGLEELFEQQHADGTVLTRSELEEARRTHDAAE